MPIPVTSAATAITVRSRYTARSFCLLAWMDEGSPDPPTAHAPQGPGGARVGRSVGACVRAAHRPAPMDARNVNARCENAFDELND
jgi:hypothetical protein